MLAQRSICDVDLYEYCVVHTIQLCPRVHISCSHINQSARLSLSKVTL